MVGNAYPEKRPVSVFGGCHACTEGIVGKAIIIFTTWPWRWFGGFKNLKVATHSSIGFVYEDGSKAIFEAREGSSWQGPIDVERVEAWVARNPKKRRFTMYPVPLYMVGREHAVFKEDRCRAMLKVWTYSIFQLPRMGLRKYLPFLPMKPTPNRVVCSEASSVILAPDVDICKLVGKSSFDRITPFDFEQAMKELCAKPRHEVADLSDAYTG